MDSKADAGPFSGWIGANQGNALVFADERKLAIAKLRPGCDRKAIRLEVKPWF